MGSHLSSAAATTATSSTNSTTTNTNKETSLRSRASSPFYADGPSSDGRRERRQLRLLSAVPTTSGSSNTLPNAEETQIDGTTRSKPRIVEEKNTSIEENSAEVISSFSRETPRETKAAKRHEACQLEQH